MGDLAGIREELEGMSFSPEACNIDAEILEAAIDRFGAETQPAGGGGNIETFILEDRNQIGGVPVIEGA